jgi:hypothetical protein
VERILNLHIWGIDNLFSISVNCVIEVFSLDSGELVTAYHGIYSELSFAPSQIHHCHLDNDQSPHLLGPYLQHASWLPVSWPFRLFYHYLGSDHAGCKLFPTLPAETMPSEHFRPRSVSVSTW